MEGTMVLDPRDFELPEEAKVTRVFERLIKINDAVTENGVRDIYYEHHDQYEESYSICLF